MGICFPLRTHSEVREKCVKYIDTIYYWVLLSCRSPTKYRSTRTRLEHYLILGALSSTQYCYSKAFSHEHHCIWYIRMYITDDELYFIFSAKCATIESKLPWEQIAAQQQHYFSSHSARHHHVRSKHRRMKNISYKNISPSTTKPLAFQGQNFPMAMSWGDDVSTDTAGPCAVRGSVCTLTRMSNRNMCVYTLRIWTLGDIIIHSSCTGNCVYGAGQIWVAFGP